MNISFTSRICLISTYFISFFIPFRKLVLHQMILSMLPFPYMRSAMTFLDKPKSTNRSKSVQGEYVGMTRATETAVAL